MGSSVERIQAHRCRCIAGGEARTVPRYGAAYLQAGVKDMSGTAHQDRILDQFTRQATPFSTANTITDANALRMIVEAAAPKPGDTMLDVACGGGIVVCAFAPHVKHATGIDMTPAMLDRARQLAAGKGLTNVAFRQVD